MGKNHKRTLDQMATLVAALLIALSMTSCTHSSGGSAHAIDAGDANASTDAHVTADATSDTSASPDATSDTGSSADAAADASRDAADTVADTSNQGPPPTLTHCPTTRIQTPGACYVVLPTATGASASGQNASSPSVALAPAPNVTPRHQLVLYLNGSGGHPSGIATPTVNFYDTAASLGYAVLAVSYRSDKTVASLCTPQGGKFPVDSCYFPTRKTLIVGTYQSGASQTVANMRVDESIAGRTLLALRYLAAGDPNGGWDGYFKPGNPGVLPEKQIVWSKIVVAGHSQGGGHAAAIGKLFPVARVIQLASTCDAVLASVTPLRVKAASWTNGSAQPWASDPSKFWGLAVKTVFTNGRPTGGDTVCFMHLAVWKNLGMLATHQNDNAATCTRNGAPVGGHGAPVLCPQNANAWKAMLQ